MKGDVELCLTGDSLTDRCATGTTVTDNGTATFTAVDSGELEYTTASGGTITAPVTTGGYCYGWEEVSGVWTFREVIADWTGVSESGGTLTIADGTKFTRLVYTNTQPTAEDLIKFEAEDRPAFNSGASILLVGTSDAITALDHDAETDLLHVGTSGGRSEFNGLVRTGEDTATTSQSLTSISAKDGELMEGK
jgi:hypothetical protein